MKNWRLGLIGGNITASRSPLLHTVCGLAAGGNATYDLLVPDEWGLSFDAMLAHCEAAGFDGVNVTYPYKETAAATVRPGDPLVAAMGSANTVCFTQDGPRAFNTDYTGFMAAFRALWPERVPGRVLVLGTGGVGRAVVFGLAQMGVGGLVLHDTDPARIASLTRAVTGQFDLSVHAADADTLADLSGFDGVVNCTPLGMTGRPGSPLPGALSGRPGWAFDAVYTPEHTTFRGQLEGLGADFLSGYELYFHQGVQAFAHFSGGAALDTGWVRSVISRPVAG